jgi:hypothetical protein
VGLPSLGAVRCGSAHHHIWQLSHVGVSLSTLVPGRQSCMGKDLYPISTGSGGRLGEGEVLKPHSGLINRHDQRFCHAVGIRYRSRTTVPPVSPDGMHPGGAPLYRKRFWHVRGRIQVETGPVAGSDRFLVPGPPGSVHVSVTTKKATSF